MDQIDVVGEVLHGRLEKKNVHENPPLHEYTKFLTRVLKLKGALHELKLRSTVWGETFEKLA